MTTQPLLDEQDFNAPDFLVPLPDQNIDAANNFCWYFQSSQFFEPASNNNAILNAHVNDPATYWVIHDRKEFNERLKSIPSGLQFVVAAEPQGEGQPWVYQRQNKVRDSEGKVDTFVEGNWYNQGTRIMMAPSLLDVVRARMLTVSTRLQQVAELSQNMAHWSPATGYSYFPPSYEAPKAAATGSRMGSRIGSPVLAPTDPDAAASQSQAQPADAAASTTEFSDALFLQSLNLTNRYGDEYMDENPLTGEPGAFVFEKTRNAVDARNKAQVQSSQATQSSQASTIAKLDTQPPSTAPSVAPTPKAAATPVPLEAHSRKGSIASIPKDKKRERRKSKGLASPTTPGNPPGL